MTNNTPFASDNDVTLKDPSTEVEADKIKGRQELDEIHNLIHQPSFAVVYPETEIELGYPVARRILDWHNKQIEELLDRAKHIAEPNLDEDPYHYQVRVQNAIKAERNKLRERDDE